MDAAHTYFNKTVLFLATALLLAVPGRATNPTFNLAHSASSTVNVTVGNQATSVDVDTSDQTQPITFGTTTTYTNPPYVGDNWLSVTSSGALITGTTLYLSVANTSEMVSGVTYRAMVTLTSTLPVAGITGTINVSLTNGPPSGTGTITPTPSSVSLSAAAGSTTPATYNISLSTTSTTAVSFTATSSASWLTPSPTSSSVVSGNPINLTIGASAASLTSNVYTGSITITPFSGTSSTISVTFTVGTGTGTGNLTASPNPFSWTYTTNSGVYPSAQTVALTSATGATGFSTTVNNYNPWLYTNPASGNLSSGFQILPGASINSLATGNYTGYVYVQASDGSTVTVTVNLSVNGASTSGITWYPNPASITATVGGYTQQLTVSLSSATAGTFTASIGGSGLSVSGVSTSTTSPAAASVIVYGNPTGLSANTYPGTLYVTLTPSGGGSAVNQQIPISFVVGSGGTGTASGIVTPTSLTFAYQTGTAVTSLTLPSQSVLVSGTGQFTVAAPTYGANQTGGWLTVSPSAGYAPAMVSMSVSPTSLAAGTYTATVAVTPASGTATLVSVSFLVTASPVLVAYPGTLNFSYTAGGGIPSSPLYLSASDTSAMTVTATTSTAWLSVSSPTSTTPIPISVQGNNLTSLANGVYTGTVTLTVTGAANSPVNVPVVLTVTGSTASGGSLTLSPSSMTFNAIQNGTAPASQTLSVSASTLTYYTATATSTGNWLSISPSGNLNTSSYAGLAVSVSQTGLTANTYYGTITLVANGITQTVQVTLVVSTSSSSGSGNVTVAPTSINFGTYQVGGTVPAAQSLLVTSAAGSASVSFTISSNAAWLSAGVANGTSLNTPVTFAVGIVSMNLSSLAAGLNTATITITPNGGTVVTVPVTLTVTAAPTVSATPTTLSFAYQAGGADPTPGTVNVSGAGQSLPFTAQITAGGNWLSVSPSSGTTPTTGTAALTVTATPGTLAAGSYIGTLLVSGAGIATGSSTSITVTLTVTAPLPTINSVVNAASFIRGPVSPGEIVTLFGTAMGPATAAYAAIDASTGKLATTIGGVQVFFNGIPAPMIYATATQISAVVPYEMAPIANPSVWVKYVGQTSNAYPLNSATTMPGLFTQNASGSGPGAILNQNNILNGPNNPAAAGSIVQVFMTGEGQTSPQGVTGKITAATLPPPQVTPAPLLPVSVLINGQPALWTYAGEAPSMAAGLMQLNVQIPATAPSGNLSIAVSIGSNMSQSNVTVSVSGASTAQCATFPSSLVPFISEYYVTSPNIAYDRLFVGKATMNTWNQLSQLPLPAFTNQQFCGSVQLAPGVMATVYVPTSAERNGDFSAFAGLFLDPLTNFQVPFPGGILPASRIPDPWAMRVVSVL